MDKLVILLLSALFASGTQASCFGTESNYTCSDPQSGNTYNVTKFGGTTTMTGTNSRTGSSWSQNSRTYGSTTYQDGKSSDGRTWRQTIQNNGAIGTTYSGTDSNGNRFHKTCTQFGCY